ncbi:MAG: hypothetical protein A2Y64_02290 [Candidatus Coatesbacteria bacterium RBG_13_66_14]|uniref:VCBS repeat-containing protein n=1 Tax=Candidatus Coatesbacteria bacterium RBG_13_66_14 TaxID=1817816 RepID=A0A1F5FB35_9BACT|nr:MAG: hypothetical protein A2Y64_02290 [Candidatus Coatesbacteria bacterium RBG_13_66_14]
MRAVGSVVLVFSVAAGANPLPVPRGFESPTPPQPEASTFETDTVFGDCGYYRVDAVREAADPLNRFGALELHYIDDSLSPGVDWHLQDTYEVWVYDPAGNEEPLGYDARFEDVDGDRRPECVVTLRRVETAGNDEVVLEFGLDGFTVVLGLDEDLISLPLELDGDGYTVEALRRRYGWFAPFGEVRLYRSEEEEEGGRVPVDVYPDSEETDFYGGSLDLEDYTGDGRPEAVVYTNMGGNDPLICCGLVVLEPTPGGLTELYYEPMLAPFARDADSDGVTEIFTYTAYTSSFVVGRAYRASFIDRVFVYEGGRYVPGELADYKDFLLSRVTEEERYYAESLLGDYPEAILGEGQSVLAQLAAAGLDAEYALWWEGHREELRGATLSIHDGDWDEVERVFSTPDALRAEWAGMY